MKDLAIAPAAKTYSVDVKFVFVTLISKRTSVHYYPNSQSWANRAQDNDVRR